MTDLVRFLNEVYCREYMEEYIPDTYDINHKSENEYEIDNNENYNEYCNYEEEDEEYDIKMIYGQEYDVLDYKTYEFMRREDEWERETEEYNRKYPGYWQIEIQNEENNDD